MEWPTPLSAELIFTAVELLTDSGMAAVAVLQQSHSAPKYTAAKTAQQENVDELADDYDYEDDFE